jgi:hypothetical protein
VTNACGIPNRHIIDLQIKFVTFAVVIAANASASTYLVK